MTDREAQRLRDDYLGRLDAAIAELPWRVANELRSGVAEQLDGLDAAELHARTMELGDPERIAAAAQEEMGSGSAPVVVVAAAPVAKAPMVDTKWFAVVGALALGFGGFLLPIGGWVVGVALVTSSRFWRRWEKAVAILVPFGAAVLALLATAIVSAIAPETTMADPRNPVLPASFALWNLALVVVLMVPVCALWLLWRLRGRDVPRR